MVLSAWQKSVKKTQEGLAVSPFGRLIEDTCGDFSHWVCGDCNKHGAFLGTRALIALLRKT